MLYNYPFIYESVRLLPSLLESIYLYDSTSCHIIVKILSAGMTTCDLLTIDAPTVSDKLLLNNLWQAFWEGHVAFYRVASTTNGTKLLTISASSRDILLTFSSWDPIMQLSPFSDIGDSFLNLLLGVSA